MLTASAVAGSRGASGTPKGVSDDASRNGLSSYQTSTLAVRTGSTSASPKDASDSRKVSLRGTPTATEDRAGVHPMAPALAVAQEPAAGLAAGSAAIHAESAAAAARQVLGPAVRTSGRKQQEQPDASTAASLSVTPYAKGSSSPLGYTYRQDSAYPAEASATSKTGGVSTGTAARRSGSNSLSAAVVPAAPGASRGDPTRAEAVRRGPKRFESVRCRPNRSSQGGPGTSLARGKRDRAELRPAFRNRHRISAKVRFGVNGREPGINERNLRWTMGKLSVKDGEGRGMNRLRCLYTNGLRWLTWALMAGALVTAAGSFARAQTTPAGQCSRIPSRTAGGCQTCRRQAPCRTPCPGKEPESC